MRNPDRFEFKSFSVHQQRSVMKVCTDSCAFGALAEINLAKTILDIGTGTGLLSLMLAQKASHEIHIDAIDIDSETLLDAHENILSSPWKDSITLYHDNVATWKHEAVYDMIISNPPFHVRSTSSKHQQEAVAFHADHSLPFSELASVLNSRSHQDTRSWILLPINEMQQFLSHALSEGLHVQKSIIIHDSIDHDPTRSIAILSKQVRSEPVEVVHFTYREYAGGPFTPEFITTLSPFYHFL